MKNKVGKYHCESCRRTWYSICAVQNKYQICVSCNTKTFPQIMYYNTDNPPKYLQHILSRMERQIQKEHLGTHCQNCIEGRYCRAKERIRTSLCNTHITPKHKAPVNKRQDIVSDHKMRSDYERLWFEQK